MRILIVGAGATGGFYGGLLAKAGREVTFLLRERRAGQVRAHGIEILTHLGEHLTVHPEVLTARELQAHPVVFDLILISTKSYQLAAALEDIAPAVGPQTILLPVLNGMAQLGALSERFGAERVVGGSVRIMSYLDEQNRVVQMNELDQLNFGELSGERTERILAVERALNVSGYRAQLQENILDTLWQKWTLLTSMGAICVLARGNAGQVAAAPYGAAFARAVIQESAAVAAANGYPAPEPIVEMHVRRMTEPNSTITSSMYRDMVAGAPVEADHILGDFLDRAKGVPVPLLTAAYVQLKIYEAERANTGA